MMLTCPLATLAFPHQYPALHEVDAWIGLGLAGVSVFNASPALDPVSKAAHCSMKLQYPQVILALTASSRFLRPQQYIFTVLIALAVEPRAKNCYAIERRPLSSGKIALSSNSSADEPFNDLSPGVPHAGPGLFAVSCQSDHAVGSSAT
jgi:hypothetical protein